MAEQNLSSAERESGVGVAAVDSGFCAGGLIGAICPHDNAWAREHYPDRLLAISDDAWQSIHAESQGMPNGDLVNGGKHTPALIMGYVQ